LGDKKAWPVYVMIGNILSQTRNSPAKMPILLLALLPVPPKLTGDSGRADQAQRKTNTNALRAVFDIVLAPLQEIVQEGTVMDCADGKTRLCFPILSAWIADHAEHAALHEIGSKSYPKCEVPSKDLGGNPGRYMRPATILYIGKKHGSTSLERLARQNSFSRWA